MAPGPAQLSSRRPLLRGSSTSALTRLPARLQGIACDAVVESSTLVPGCGLLGVVEGRRLVVGTAELLAEQGVVDTGGRMAAAAQELGGKGECYPLRSGSTLV